MAFFRGISNKEQINVQIQTTSICTGKCIMCPYMESWHKHNPGVMEDTIFDRILEQLSYFQISKICPYLENEPLADKKIFQRISKIRKNFPETSIEISTNALALSDTNIDKLLNVLSGGPHDIWISFHGIDKVSYEGIMGLPFEKCYSNIVHLLKAAESENLRISLRGAGIGRVKELNHQFCFNKEAYISFWEETFRKFNIAKRPKIEFFSYHDRAGSIARNSIHLKDIVRKSLNNFSCKRLTNWMHFLYTGELILCCMDYHRETIFGNIQNNTILEIFKSKEYNQLGLSVTGKSECASNFICKRCISPGG